MPSPSGRRDVLISLRTLCFLQSDTRVLLLHRRHAPNAGLWNGIGGKLNPGEDPYAACTREVSEETGLRIDHPVLRAVLVISVKSTGDLWVLFTFTAPAPPENPVASEEGELRWIELNALGTLPVLPDLPLLLPYILSTAEVLTVRLDLNNDDAASLVRAEIVGPADQAKVLFERHGQ
jgi:8-oxo-dGTP diphosphatase